MRKFFNAIKWKIQEVKWFVQRGRRGYADCDLWSFDHYLAGMISVGLKDFRNRMHSHPGQLTVEAWDKILDEIAEGFDAANKIISDDLPWDPQDHTVFEKAHEAAMCKFFNGMELMKSYFFHLWD
jgi:hypothetical protein